MCNLLGYTLIVIKSFDHKGLEKLFYDDSKRGVKPEHAEKLKDILDRLDAASSVNDMDYPGSGLHPLKGDLKGRWAVKVSGNWRMTFRFENGDAYVVDYTDYH
jgi:proteic killer suppression protein